MFSRLPSSRPLSLPIVLLVGAVLAMEISSYRLCQGTPTNTSAVRQMAALQNPDEDIGPTITDPSVRRRIQRKVTNDFLKSNVEKMKADASEIHALAESLQKELENSNEKVLSLEVIKRADKIEKLAKRIKATARGW